jgi:hypothetical protein
VRSGARAGAPSGRLGRPEAAVTGAEAGRFRWQAVEFVIGSAARAGPVRKHTPRFSRRCSFGPANLETFREQFLSATPDMTQTAAAQNGRIWGPSPAAWNR